MANDTGVRGLYPILHQNGAPPQLMVFRANTTDAIYRGMPMFLNNSGQVQCVSADTSANSNVSIGVAWEFLDANHAGLVPGMTLLPNSIGGTNYGPFLPASTDAFVGVLYDPLQLYEMEEDTAGTALVITGTANCGKGIGWTWQATSGNKYTGYANITLLRGSQTSSTANLLQLIAIEDKINNDATLNAPGNYCKWVVRIQRHQLGNAWVSVPL